MEIRSSSSTPITWEYDVFVSFRGEDTRYNFTDHLFGALYGKGFHAFRDDTKLRKGENISTELIKAIEGSQILIVVFSKNFASSTWCLQELAKIADCIGGKRQTVLPIFCDVSPSEVRKQSENYEEAFMKHEERFKEDLQMVQRWRTALAQVTNLSGWDVTNKPQHALIGEVIKRVTCILSHNVSWKELGTLLKRLEENVMVVKAVLNDAENRQISNDSDVNDWLNELKDVVYMADDLLDEVSTKAATHKEVTSNLSSRLTEIVQKQDRLLQLKVHLHALTEIATDNSLSKDPSTSVPDRKIYGRDKEKNSIIKLLLNDNSSNNNEAENVSVIPIVGMGGVGKTTLAQMVYHDEALNQNFNFDLKAWVCVSESFDIIKVTKTLTETLTKQVCQINNFNSLQENLVQILRGKKFFIILDDVWNKDYDSWNQLQKPFQYGMKGSKILVTTRSDEVASVVQTDQTFHLNRLSEEHCWSVFANHACLSQGSGKNETTLEKIGLEIVKKCKGLPLAAQSLGGLLRRKRDIKDWHNVLYNGFWELSKSESKIIPSLRISYHYLPPYLKHCFVYFSLFPKDFEFKKKDVILLWMAEDLLPPKKGKAIEDIGDECFDYLVSSSFLQRSSTRYVEECFLMHDLMHDLATFLGGEFYFRTDDLGEETRIGSKTRHLSFINFSSPNSEFIGVLDSSKFLRTFLRTKEYSNYGRVEVISCSFEELSLQYLRVLSFRYFRNYRSLPYSIGEMIHLRYLDLSRTAIESLPESLCSLYNLQTLKLEGCQMLTVLPRGMQNLVNLHYLGIDETGIQEMPKGMGKLKKLQHLPYFIVGKHEEIKIKELGGLSNLGGSFSIGRLEMVGCGSEALEARMMDKKHISI